MTGDPYLTAEAFVRAVLTGAQKARSNLMETFEGDEMMLRLMIPERLQPDHKLSIMEACDRVLATGTVTGSDAANISYLLHQDPSLEALVSVHPMMQGMEPFPEFMECIERWGSGL